MGTGQVVDVDVVAYARAVGCVVVVAEHAERFAAREERFDGDRDEVERVRPVFSQSGVEAGSSCVEVPQAHAPHAMDLAVPVQHPFHHRFGLGVDRLRVDRL